MPHATRQSRELHAFWLLLAVLWLLLFVHSLADWIVYATRMACKSNLRLPGDPKHMGPPNRPRKAKANRCPSQTPLPTACRLATHQWGST